MLRHTAQRLLKIHQMLPLIHTAIPHNTDGQHTILVVFDYLREDKGLINGGTHRDGVVAGNQGEVSEGGSAYVESRVGGITDVVTERDVALGEETG